MQMKTTFNKITSSLMAVLVLFSTLSITVEKHFCGEFLVDVSYFGTAQNCAEEIGEDEGCDVPGTIKKKCCKDEIAQIEGQDDLRNTPEKFDLVTQQFLLAFTISYTGLFEYVSKQSDPHKDYGPPKLTKDIQVLHEVFII